VSAGRRREYRPPLVVVIERFGSSAVGPAARSNPRILPDQVRPRRAIGTSICSVAARGSATTVVAVSLEIRTPKAGDADGLGQVHVRAWQVAYSGGLMPEDYLNSLSETERASLWRTSLENPPRPRATRLVATVDDEVIGFALVGPAGGEENSNIVELYAINVDPDHWGNRSRRSVDRRCHHRSASEPVHISGSVGPSRQRTRRRFFTSGGWIDDKIDRRQEVLGVEVPEVRLSLDLVA